MKGKCEYINRVTMVIRLFAPRTLSTVLIKIGKDMPRGELCLHIQVHLSISH
jgi:hypothetical protein